MASIRSSRPMCAAQNVRCRSAVVTRCQVQTDRLAAVRTAGVAMIASLSLMGAAPSYADLNPLEAEVSGEFGVGSAMQYGEADIQHKDFSNMDLRRSNFTSADCKFASFKNSKLTGAYFIKAVAFKTDFEGADLSDTLMDRAVLNEANFTNAVLQRAVLVRSDLGKATIQGADFTNALVDKVQQMELCKYADGVNPVTGVSTRKSLGCGSSRKFRAMSPSSPEGPQVTDDEKDAFRATMPTYRQ